MYGSSLGRPPLIYMHEAPLTILTAASACFQPPLQLRTSVHVHIRCIIQHSNGTVRVAAVATMKRPITGHHPRQGSRHRRRLTLAGQGHQMLLAMRRQRPR